eukprot:TRINITY_DN4348_c0_g1_i1.p3 TRINITY_DN4348_c0_g1~~TRINITY_DN4348_c0_g1_i1.p3  ORF type:complete len:57 (-),score=4.64 TRINITY_DN4348_c0_g1_i1:154-324(-)
MVNTPVLQHERAKNNDVGCAQEPKTETTIKVRDTPPHTVGIDDKIKMCDIIDIERQ